MYVKRISSLLAAVFLACCILTNGNQYSEVLQILNCVSKSGDQELCNGIFDCNTRLAKPYRDAYYDCARLILPNGIGRCDENSELYFTEENRRQIFGCIQLRVADDQLTDEQEKQMDEYEGCVHALGERAGCDS